MLNHSFLLGDHHRCDIITPALSWDTQLMHLRHKIGKTCKYLPVVTSAGMWLEESRDPLAHKILKHKFGKHRRKY